jgi:serine/threonine-protein kinase
LYVRSKTRGHTLAGANGFDDYAFTSPFYEGEVVSGKYEIGAMLGYSASTFVVAARRLECNDHVAIKFLRPSAFVHAAAVAQFAAEARAASGLESDFIARVFDVDCLSDGSPFIVMERLDGQSLSQRLIERGRMSCELAATYALQACAALSSAHALGILHCGVRPSNLFLSKQAQGHELVKLLDFCISRAPLDADALGSLPYTSPELMRAKPDIDGRTDIWSLGCVLYECLSGVTPFQAVSSTQVCAAVLEGEPEPLSQRIPGVVPIELEAIVMRCLEKERPLRFRNVAELSRALLRFASRGVPGSVISSAGLVAFTSELFGQAESQPAVSLPPEAALEPQRHALPKHAAAPNSRAERSRMLALLPLLAAALVALVVGHYTRAPEQKLTRDSTPQLSAARASRQQPPLAGADVARPEPLSAPPQAISPKTASAAAPSVTAAAAALDAGARVERPAAAERGALEPGSGVAAAASGHARDASHSSSASEHKRSAQHGPSASALAALPPEREAGVELKAGAAPAAAIGGERESIPPGASPPGTPSAPLEPAQAVEREAPAAASPVASPTPAAESARAAPKPAPAVPGSIAPAVIAQVIRRNAQAVQECFDRAQMDHPDLHGRMRFRATVDRFGNVTSAWADNQLPDGARLLSCILARAREWKFPPPAGGVSGSVSYTFAFD